MTGCRFREPAGARFHAVDGLAAMLLLLVLAGCGTTRSFAPRSEFVAFSPEQKTEVEANVTRAYRIQDGDVLKIHFAYERELNQDDVVVLSDGVISLIGIDPIRLGGLTMAEADSALTLAYSREYREPALSVMMEKTQGRRVYVLGEVRDPGVYTVPQGGQDVISAITMASGFSEDAARDGILIIRVTKEGYQFQELNLDSIGTAQFAQLASMPLLPFDIIYVPRSRVGNFANFAKSVLTGIGQFTQIAYDLYIISGGQAGRF